MGMHVIIFLMFSALPLLLASEEDMENINAGEPTNLKQTTVVMMCENTITPNEPTITKTGSKPQPRGPQQLRIQVWRSMAPQQPLQNTSSTDQDSAGTSIDEFLLPEEPAIPPIVIGNGIQEEEVNMAVLPVGPACMEVSNTGSNHLAQPLYITTSSTNSQHPHFG